MGRTITNGLKALMLLVNGALGIYATIRCPLDSVLKTDLIFAVSAVTAIVIFLIVLSSIFEQRDRVREKSEHEKLNRMVAELHERIVPTKSCQTDISTSATEITNEPIAGEGHTVQSPQLADGKGVVRNIADEVRDGRPFARFKFENITSLRAAGLRLAQLYRTFANESVDLNETSNGKYMIKFWECFPFGELDAIKLRLKNILGFEVSSAALELPSQPIAVNRLAAHLEKESLKIPDDVPL